MDCSSQPTQTLQGTVPRGWHDSCTVGGRHPAQRPKSGTPSREQHARVHRSLTSNIPGRCAVARSRAAAARARTDGSARRVGLRSGSAEVETGWVASCGRRCAVDLPEPEAHGRNERHRAATRDDATDSSVEQDPEVGRHGGTSCAPGAAMGGQTEPIAGAIDTSSSPRSGRPRWRSSNVILRETGEVARDMRIEPRPELGKPGRVSPMR
jgi:hypothetical protein